MKPQKANISPGTGGMLGVRRLVGAGVEVEHSAPGGEQTGLEERLGHSSFQMHCPSFSQLPTASLLRRGWLLVRN